MNLCVIQSTPLGEGRWRHTCRICGRDKIAPVPTAVYRCEGTCRHLGVVLFDDADRPLTTLVPCRGCNAGDKPYTVWECNHCMTTAACIPNWRPAPDDLAGYQSREGALSVCADCEFREANCGTTNRVR